MSDPKDPEAPSAVKAVAEPAHPTIFSDLLVPKKNEGISVPLVLLLLVACGGLVVGGVLLTQSPPSADGGVADAGLTAAALPTLDAGTLPAPVPPKSPPVALTQADAGTRVDAQAPVDAGVAVPPVVATPPAPPQKKKPTGPPRPPGPLVAVEASAPASVEWMWRDYVVGHGTGTLKVPEDARTLAAEDKETKERRRLIIINGRVNWNAAFTKTATPPPATSPSAKPASDPR